MAIVIPSSYADSVPVPGLAALEAFSFQYLNHFHCPALAAQA